MFKLCLPSSPGFSNATRAIPTWLQAFDLEEVAMESTGVYWKLLWRA